MLNILKMFKKFTHKNIPCNNVQSPQLVTSTLTVTEENMNRKNQQQ